MYYFSDISDSELCLLDKPYAPNFSIKLSDILHKTNGAFDNKLFKIDEVVTGSVYRVYPMFNCKTISSTGASDKVFENRLIICKKETAETYVTFISDETQEVQDYSSYGTYYSIGDSLTDAQFNSIIDLIRANTVNTDSFRLKQGLVNGNWADYTFDIDGTTVTDQGILITDETLTSLGRVMLTNRKLHYTTYTLKLKVYHITDINIFDEESAIEVDTLDITLVEDEWVTIPFTLLDYNYIVGFDATVEIKHDVPVIPDVPKHIYLSTDKPIIQTGEKSDLTALVKDIGGVPVVGHDVYFYEEYEPYSLLLTTDNSIIQSGSKSDIVATLKDEDGSLVAEEDIYFYQSVTDGYLINETTEYTHNVSGLKTLFELTDLPSRWELSCDFKTTTESRLIIGSKDGFTGTNPNNNLIVGSPNGSKAYYGYRDTSTHTTELSSVDVTSYTSMKIAYDNGNAVFTIAGTEYTVNNITVLNNVTDFVVGMVSWSNSATVYVKNLKLKVYGGE